VPDELALSQLRAAAAKELGEIADRLKRGFTANLTRN
jgi:hypothetical protein